MNRRVLRTILYCSSTLCSLSMLASTALANPQGGVVSAGSAAISSSGKNLTINQSSNKAVIDWRSFNIAPNETTTFNQPSSSSITLNRVNDVNPSSIEGQLSASGNIIIFNPNGVMFSKSAQLDVAGMTVTTSNISNDKFMGNGPL